MPAQNWSDIARHCSRFEGKRLSEIAVMVLGGDTTGKTLEPDEYYIAVKALALGWLDIVKNNKNQYQQQQIDREGITA